MKKQIVPTLLACFLITMVGCTKESAPSKPPITPDAAEDSPTHKATEPSALTVPSPTEDKASAMVIQVGAGENAVTFRLNDSVAAKHLYEQLPLSLKVEDYSNNEKIFYPPKPLDVSGAPKAASGAGTLAYYAPWADVVMFYGRYSPSDSLYELGQVVSGSEHIRNLSGTAEVSKSR